MSSRFVSAGTIGPGGDDEAGKQPPARAAASKNPEWEAIQQELEAERKRRDEARVKAAAGEEPSLYDILQANKAAKQAAFEEKHKLKNQFRPLDDDEALFLDEVRERERRDEEQVRRETDERLRAFRMQQRRRRSSEAGGAAEPSLSPPDQREEEEEEWGPVGRKRKRSARDVKGVKRKVGGDVVGEAVEAAGLGKGPAKSPVVEGEQKPEGEGEAKEKAKEKAKAPSALVEYGSDESD